MTTRNPNMCISCKHLKPGSLDYGATWRCTAFPDGIPDDIWAGGEQHVEVRGDERGGVVFELKPDDRTAEIRLAQYMRWNEVMNRAS